MSSWRVYERQKRFNEVKLVCVVVSKETFSKRYWHDTDHGLQSINTVNPNWYFDMTEKENAVSRISERRWEVPNRASGYWDWKLTCLRWSAPFCQASNSVTNQTVAICIVSVFPEFIVFENVFYVCMYILNLHAEQFCGNS